MTEVLNLNEDQWQWEISEATLPFSCDRLRSIVSQNRAIIFCACDDANYCTELSVTAPDTCKQLRKVPEPLRKYYRVVAFEYKVLIFGGLSVANNHLLNSVLEFDLRTKKFKAMPPLPSAVKDMAGVRWGDQAVLIGGFSAGGQSKQVLMYDSKTGNTVELPSMLEERSGCSAIITGNTVVVMGGRGKTTGRVRSVEAFTLGSYWWRYLPAMNDVRSLATATVLPTKNI